MSVSNWLLAFQLCGSCLLAIGCSKSGGSPVVHVEGTVLAIELDGRSASITAADVDEWLPTIGMVDPMTTVPARRRLALTNIVMPTVVAGLIDPPAREEAWQRANDAWDVLQEGLMDHKDLLEMEAIEGSFKETGLDVWGMALTMEVEDWSPIFETAGGWVFFRFVGIPDPPWHPATPILIERAFFPYLDPALGVGQIDGAHDRAVLTIVDPEWETLVPASFRYRMSSS